MPDQDMFGTQESKPTTTPQTTEPPRTDPFVDKLMAIKNENGEPKYKDVDTALEALAASQQFIETLKSEKKTIEQRLQEREQELTRMGSIDDFVKKLNPAAQPQQKQETPANTSGLSEERVAQLLEQSWQKKEQQISANSNLQTVQDALTNTHGERAAVFIQQKATELNTTPAKLKEMSMENPQMVLTLLGVASKPKVASPTVPSMNTGKPSTNSNERPTIERGVARGGYTNKELAEVFRKSKEFTNKRLGLET